MDYKRSHNLGELRKQQIDETVSLSGWVNRRRDHGGLIFIDLRDRFGITQLIFDPTNHPESQNLRSEWVITIKGKVIPRQEGMTNPNLPTGEIEVEVSAFEVLSKAKVPPFSICDEITEVSENLRLKYRYLDIRRGEILQNLILRHKSMMSIRNTIDTLGFIDVTTPVLAKATPEGARDYLVPSRVHHGNFYALPQSPQLFKQLLMLSGVDRYYQFATCFRDEDLRSDRQPEFMQIDMEISFGVIEDIKHITETFLIKLFQDCKNITIPGNFQEMTYKDCLEQYGTDKPDLRFGMKLVRVDDLIKDSTFSVFLDQIKFGGCVKAIVVKGGKDISRKEIDALTAFVKPFGLQGLAWMKMQDGALSSSIVKFFDEDLQKKLIQKLDVEDNDLIFFGAEKEARVNQALDHLRRHLAEKRDLICHSKYEFLWVTEFPLLEWDPEEKRHFSLHHPFTAPHPDDISLLEKEPENVRSLAYDIVLNGYEIGGGSQRIHDSDLQKKIFSLLDLSPEDIEEKFGFFAKALEYGTPPHLGIAMGFDRISMILAGTNNIRDVIAFPKTQKASDAMMDCPSLVTKEQLEELSINIEEENSL